MENRRFTTSDYNKFTSNTLDAKITQKKLVNESDLDKMIKTLGIKEEIKTLATKVELTAEQDKIVKLETYVLSLFIGQSYFVNDASQNYPVFQLIQKTITTISGLPYTISEWRSKRLSYEKLTPPYTANKSLSPIVLWNKTRVRL